MCRVWKSETKKEKTDFPVDHYSANSLVLFGSNPIMFKIRYVNRQVLDSTSGITMVIGQAFHRAMETYYGGNETMIVSNEEEAIEMGLKVGMGFLEAYNDGFIKWSTTIPNKQTAQEIFAFAFRSYVSEMPYDNGDEILSTEEKLEEKVTVEWKGKKINLPVRLKGYTDKIVRRDGKLIIIDYKTCRSFSDPDKIDGSKILQSIMYYFLAYGKYGEEPYSIVFEEVKTSKNKDGGKQVQKYEIVFKENELFFDFFFRYYEDVTRALNGEQVYVPNVNALYDGDIALIAYIHRLDDEAVVAEQKKKLKVDNVTDVLKLQIQNANSMKKLLKTVEKDFISAKSLNYENMKPEDRITTKLMEYGLLMKFDSVVNGRTLDLYRFNPSIGLKMSKIRSFVADLEQVLGVSGIRVLTPIPNSTMVGVEVPRSDRTFPELPKTEEFDLAIGENVMGEIRRFDIRNAPHILVAGSSGSGKSIFLHSLIQQLIGKADLHLYDPKQVEFFQYEEQVTEYKHSAEGIRIGLENLVQAMELRYDAMKSAKVRNITGMPDMRYKVVIIDEYADLAGRESTNSLIQQLAQKGRACGIHLIVATQRASSTIITGDVKVNFPVKVVLRMSKEIDSRVMIDEAGAERLLGKGDMLFAGDWGIERLQGFKC